MTAYPGGVSDRSLVRGGALLYSLRHTPGRSRFGSTNEKRGRDAQTSGPMAQED